MLTGNLLILIPLILFILAIHLWWRDFALIRVRYGNRTVVTAPAGFPRTPPKPPWVQREVLKLKALMPDAGCRAIALVFNRRRGVKRMSVGKSYVHDLIRKYQFEIHILRRQIKKTPPKLVPHNLAWGLDLTGKTDNDGNTHTLLGIIEHHSRACLALRSQADKGSATLLRLLLDLIDAYGRPACVRSDNESVFTSRLFRLGLWLLGIRHQRTDLACPWQNGRVERFFGTLKEKLDQWEIAGVKELHGTLQLFRLWYNHVRPHSALKGYTPAEIWSGTDLQTSHCRQPLWFDACDDLLVGDYWPSV